MGVDGTIDNPVTSYTKNFNELKSTSINEGTKRRMGNG
jgi:hypothetical protein